MTARRFCIDRSPLEAVIAFKLEELLHDGLTFTRTWNIQLFSAIYVDHTCSTSSNIRLASNVAAFAICLPVLDSYAFQLMVQPRFVRDTNANSRSSNVDDFTSSKGNRLLIRTAIYYLTK